MTRSTLRPKGRARLEAGQVRTGVLSTLRNTSSSRTQFHGTPRVELGNPRVQPDDRRPNQHSALRMFPLRGPSRKSTLTQGTGEIIPGGRRAFHRRGTTAGQACSPAPRGAPMRRRKTIRASRSRAHEEASSRRGESLTPPGIHAETLACLWASYSSTSRQPTQFTRTRSPTRQKSTRDGCMFRRAAPPACVARIAASSWQTMRQMSPSEIKPPRRPMKRCARVSAPG